MIVEEETFYVARFPDGEYAFNEQEEAIDKLRSESENVDLDEDTDVSIVEVDFSDDDWSVVEMPWQKIAFQLLNGD